MPTNDLAPLPILDWDVELKVDEPPQAVSLLIEQELLLGRTPNGKAEMPSVDFSPYNGVELGVSRRHGLLTNVGDGVTFTDLGGDNGSSLNGLHLTPHKAERLKTGDVLLLGQFKAEVSLKSHQRKTSILAARPDLNFNGAQVRGRNQRILVVEDDASVAEMYRIALERGGFSVQIAREMVSAIRMLNHFTPNAIVLDVMLPGIRGIELARYVRRDTECPDIPIVVTTALSTPDAIKNAMDSGVDVFMAKPLDWRELTRVVGTLVQKIETTNPMLQTKKLAGTASLNYIPAATRQDTIVMFLDTYREPVTKIVEKQITLGRQNPSASPSSGADHMNLDDFGALDKGVSRMHLSIRRIGKQFEIEDLSSANGTYVNGYSIPPHQAHPLKNGDEVRLGDLRIHVYFLSETEVAER